MLIYLAHPIDQESTALEALIATQRFNSLGHVVFDPATAWHVPANAIPSASLQEANIGVLGECEVVVVLLPPRVPTVGSVTEATIAHLIDKPLLIVTPVTSWTVSWFNAAVVPDIEAAAAWLGPVLTEGD